MAASGIKINVDLEPAYLRRLNKRYVRAVFDPNDHSILHHEYSDDLKTWKRRSLRDVLDEIAWVKAIGDQHVCCCGDSLDHDPMAAGHTPVSLFIQTLDVLEREAEGLGYRPDLERVMNITRDMCRGQGF